MSFVESDRFVASRVVAPLIGGLLLAAAYHSGAHATPEANGVYIISDHDGYGVVECLTQKRSCGKIVADSWCEAHGHGPALSFGRADDITGSIGPARREPISADVAIVACRD